MISFTIRNLKLFFKDKTTVFFSLLSVLIIIGLYALFLGDVWTESLNDLPNSDLLMNAWIMAGIVSVTSVTTCMGAFGIYVNDIQDKKYKDFYCSPIKRSHIAFGYIFSAYIIGVIMSIVALFISQIYMLLSFKEIVSFPTILLAVGLIIVGNLTSTGIIFFLVSFFKTSNAFATASTIIGTLIGFLTGIYLPIGSLPSAVQTIIKIFPISHLASLFRQILMGPFADKSFANIPLEYQTKFYENMGVIFKIGDITITPIVSIIILLASAALFFGLGILKISKSKIK